MEAGKSVATAVPIWLRDKISEKQIEQISSAVKSAEQLTSGEIVPMVVRSSVSLGSARLACLLTAVSIVAVLDLTFFIEWPWWTLILSQVAAIFVGILAQRIDWILERFVPDTDEMFAVQERAELEFYRQGLTKTKDQTGILIFVSLFERKVVLLADKGINDKLLSPMWDEIVEKLSHEIKTGELALGLTQAIKSCGDLLQVHFPIKKEDKNELKNDLVICE